MKVLPQTIRNLGKDLIQLEVMEVPEGQEDYSSYVAYVSNWASIYSVLCGFTFTAIAIILTLHPEPSLITVQVALFTLTTLLNIFALLMYRFSTTLGFAVGVVPKFPKAWTRWSRTFMFLAAIGWTLLGMTVVLMFFLWNLHYLAIASGVVTTLFIIFGYIGTVKTFLEFEKKHPWIQKQES